MIPKVRYIFSGVCFLGVAVILLSADFSDRGTHFLPGSARAKTDRSGTYDLGKARILNKVAGHVRAHYVDPSRVEPRRMAVSALQAVQGMVAEVAVEVGRDKQSGDPQWLKVTVDDASQRFELERVTDLYEAGWLLMSVFDFLERHLPPALDLEEVEYAAVNGLLSTLDPHTILLPPRVYREMQVQSHGRFGGLGITVSTRAGVLTVASVMPRTPAARAGLQPEDKIVQIGEESTINMPLNDAVARLRGEIGTEVTIWVKREGWAAPKSFAIVREEIRIPSVDHEDLGDGLGYVRIRNFQENTFDDLQDALKALSRTTTGLKGLVLDLRDNPGGLLDQAISVADRFLQAGTIVTTIREGKRDREERHATAAGTLTDIPIVVLINRGAASASEIVAGALKNNDRAIVLGNTSFGKGSVQVVYKLDDAALKLTVAQYLTPGDVSIQSVGIVPDIEIVKLTAKQDLIDLRPAELEARGEARLKSHLESSQTRHDLPSVQLHILGANGKSASSKRDDPRVQLARDLLEAAPANNRRQALVQAAGFLKARQAQEEQALAARLAELGVDWKPGPAPDKAKLAAELKLDRGEGKAGRPIAGDTVRFVASVQNKGARPIHRVHGVLRSAVRGAADTEFVFGRIDPGGSRQWTVAVDLPRSLGASGDVVSLELFADGQPLEIKAALPVEVDALPQPLFSYAAQVLDGKSGNGDGLIQRGETVELAVSIENTGDGPAEDLLATIKNESGEDVFIKDGRARVGTLARGQAKTASFRLEVKSSLKPRNVQLKLSLIDQGLRTWSTDDLTLKVFPKEYAKASPLEGLAFVGKSAVGIHAGAHQDTPLVGRADSGARLQVKASARKWLNVRWGDRSGWIPRERVTLAGDAEPTPGKIARVLQHTPPRVSVDPSVLRGLITSQASIPLKGLAAFAGGRRQARRYVYVFRGEDKVFFRSAASNGNGAGRDEMAFETMIPLEPGSNELRVVGREGDGDLTQVRLTVYRR